MSLKSYQGQPQFCTNSGTQSHAKIVLQGLGSSTSETKQLKENIFFGPTRKNIKLSTFTTKNYSIIEYLQ